MADANLKFLIVDDDDEIRSITSENLRSFGYLHIWEAKRVKEAIEIINSQPLDCIIADWELPGASGYTLLRLIKAQPVFKHIVFIIVSGIQAHEEDKVARASQVKVDGYLLKPFRASKLRELLERVLK